jgi:S-adenosylmethionine hydrolase
MKRKRRQNGTLWFLRKLNEVGMPVKSPSKTALPLITLTTDFGTQDGFVGMMKGVMLTICPAARLVDISHAVPPQDVLAGALLLARAAPFFPHGTVHLAVVDPGVGTTRRALAARIGQAFFVAPDNGLLTPFLQAAEAAHHPLEVVELANPHYRLPQVSRTFHGRDLFAPAAAHLANGVPLSGFGPPVPDPARIPLPQPERTASGWRAHVIAIDTFGNLATDLLVSSLRDPSQVVVRLGRWELHGLVRSYGERSPGELVALADSAGRLELAVVDGSAARLTGALVGAALEVVE